MSGPEGLFTPPKYDPMKVGAAILFEVVEHHPTHMTIDDLVLLIVADSEDEREVATAREVIGELRRSGLLTYWDEDQIVKPTLAALQAHALLAE